MKIFGKYFGKHRKALKRDIERIERFLSLPPEELSKRLGKISAKTITITPIK